MRLLCALLLFAAPVLAQPVPPAAATWLEAFKTRGAARSANKSRPWGSKLIFLMSRWNSRSPSAAMAAKGRVNAMTANIGCFINIGFFIKVLVVANCLLAEKCIFRPPGMYALEYRLWE